MGFAGIPAHHAVSIEIQADFVVCAAPRHRLLHY
jgi:hypothetical protein